MRKTILILMLALPLIVAAQGLDVAEFYLNIGDQTANNESTKVYDDNSEVCALIKVETTQKGFVFEAGTIGVVKVDESQVGEIWVYVPAGLAKITIKHPQLGVLRDYPFPYRVESARTYVMKLICGTVDKVVKQKRTSQLLVLTFSPKQAVVEIDGVAVETEDGGWAKELSFGRHEYRISAKNYHPSVGTVEIGEEKKVLDVQLQPAFGWIEVTGPQGASVYIDGEKIGIAPIKSDAVASGNHDVQVTKEKYLPFRNREVLVSDNTVTPLNPVLTANFVTVTLKVESDAEIWVNEVKRGNGLVNVDLEPGEYSFETRKTSHRSQSIVRNITLASGGTIDLPAPVAMTGSIKVDVKPIGAKVTLDGKHVGESPVILDDVLVGTHKVAVSKAGYSDYRKNVDVVEGETTNVEGKLTGGQSDESSVQNNQQRPVETPQPVRRNTYERELGFQGMLELNSNFLSTHAGVGGDLIMGSRLTQWYHVGAGLGAYSLLNSKNKDYNVFTALYLNNVFFIPTGGNVYPVFDLGLGCNVGMLGIGKDYKETTVGLYAKSGFGIETKGGLLLSAGYEFVGTHTGYVKLGINF